ncbi:MAG TPA: hypothetical protein DGT53_03490 [Dialister sp.]|nr:hypothetical protein [Dialister sp.]
MAGIFRQKGYVKRSFLFQVKHFSGSQFRIRAIRVPVEQILHIILTMKFCSQRIFTSRNIVKIHFSQINRIIIQVFGAYSFWCLPKRIRNTDVWTAINHSIYGFGKMNIKIHQPIFLCICFMKHLG